MEITGKAEPLEEPWQERVARMLRAAQQGLNRGGAAPGHPLNLWKSVMDRGLSDGRTGLMAPADQQPPGLGTALVPDPEAWSRWGRGDAPYTMGEAGLAGRLPSLKPGRAADALNIASTLPLGAAGETKAAIGAVRRHGDIMPEKVAQKFMSDFTKDLGSDPASKLIREKVAQWLVRSAGRQDPALEAVKPWWEGPEPANYYRQWADMPSSAVRNAQKVATERGLPEAPAGSMQEVVDVALTNPFGPAALAKNHEYETSTFGWTREFPEQKTKELGINPENLRKLIDLMPEDARIARSYLGSGVTQGRELRDQITELRAWAADQPPDKLEKMTIPQMFQAREKDMVRALKEFEKTQRGEVQMRFPDGMEWQKLEPKHLEREGKLQSHCVGGYCKQVESGEKEIYSLRDKKNTPAVTIEVNKAPDRDGPYFYDWISRRLDGRQSTLAETYAHDNDFDFWGASADVQKKVLRAVLEPEEAEALIAGYENRKPRYEVRQIKGKANSVPAKYYEQVKAFLDSKGWDYEQAYDWKRLQEHAALTKNPEIGDVRVLRDVEGVEGPFGQFYYLQDDQLHAAPMYREGDDADFEGAVQVDDFQQELPIEVRNQIIQLLRRAQRGPGALQRALDDPAFPDGWEAVDPMAGL